MLRRLKRFAKGFVHDRGFRLQRLPGECPELRLNVEQIIAHRFLERGRFFFVQIGAFDGKSGDPIYRLVQAHGWPGIVVEPQPDAFAALSENYRASPQVKLENAAIADSDGVKPFYVVQTTRPDVPEWCRQLASFDLETILAHERWIPDIKNLVVTKQVPCLTFASLLRKHNVENLDLLQLDVEGYEWHILKTIDFDRFKPAIVNFEQKHLRPHDKAACFDLLHRHGYHVAITGQDALAYRPET